MSDDASRRVPAVEDFDAIAKRLEELRKEAEPKPEATIEWTTVEEGFC